MMRQFLTLITLPLAIGLQAETPSKAPQTAQALASHHDVVVIGGDRVTQTGPELSLVWTGLLFAQCR